VKKKLKNKLKIKTKIPHWSIHTYFFPTINSHKKWHSNAYYSHRSYVNLQS